MKDSWAISWKDYYEILQVIPEAEPEVIEPKKPTIDKDI
jgi:hypothetical protein